MSIRSHFMILIGVGHPYGGEGFVAHAIMELFLDVWQLRIVGESGAPYEGKLCWHSSRENLFDDALLIIGLYVRGIMAKRGSEIDHNDELIKLAKKSFKKDIFGKGRKEKILKFGKQKKVFKTKVIDIIISTQEYGEKDISDSDLKALHKKNKETLSKYKELKLIAIALGNADIDGRVILQANAARSKKLFKEAVEEYGIKNFEICESVNASFFGSFSSQD